MKVENEIYEDWSLCLDCHRVSVSRLCIRDSLKEQRLVELSALAL